MEVIKEKDFLAWRFCGDYVMSAVYYAVDHNLHGKKATYKYVEKPTFQKEVHEKKANNEGQAIIDRMNFELRSKILKDMGFPMPPH